jgi:hypothetical protein
VPATPPPPLDPRLAFMVRSVMELKAEGKKVPESLKEYEDLALKLDGAGMLESVCKPPTPPSPADRSRGAPMG